jgi:hypothetical protein
VTALLLAALTAGPPAAGRPGTGLPPVHAADHALHISDEPACGAAGGIDGGRELQREVFGFLPYWTSPSYLQYDLISILGCFSVDMGASGTITAWHGFPSAFSGPVSSVHSAGGIAVVTVVNFSSSQIHSILTTSRNTALATMVGLLDSSPVDGICIDFEGVSASDRDNLTLFVEDLRAAMDAAHPGSHLSICTPAVDWSGSFDYDELAGICDALFMMCYAFSGSWSDEAGPNCPLTGWGASPESASNMAWCLGDYVIYAPEVHEKLIVGIPYYGHEWDTEGSSPHSGVSGSCSTLLYTTLASRSQTYGREWDTESLTPWYNYYDTNWNQGWYDDPESLGLKYGLVLGSGMQGVGIWALGYDGSRPELWDCLEDWLCVPPSDDGMVDNLEDRFLLHGPAQYWHFHGSGQLWSHFYTYTVSSGPSVNWASWTVSPPFQSGQFLLEAFVPQSCTATAFYEVTHGGSTDVVAVDQAAHASQWVSLGAYSMAGGLSVTLGDSSDASGMRLGFDAVRYSEVTGIAEEERPLPSLLSVQANPASSFEIAVGAPGVLEVLDQAGRVVFRTDAAAGTVVWPDREMPQGVYHAVLSTSPVSLRLLLLR